MSSFRSDAQAFLKDQHLVLSRQYGQHFLVEESLLTRIATVGTEKSGSETIVEIGPGVGFLTKELLKHTSAYLGIERDARLLPLCAAWCGSTPNIQCADALHVSFTTLVSGAYRIVSNLPYDITTPILWKLLTEEQRRPTTITLLLQKEVVDRICAKNGEMNLLALLCQGAGEVTRVCAVPKNAFIPPPRVESAVITIINIAETPSAAYLAMLALAKQAFAAPRKKMKSTIGERAGEFGDRRPEELSIEQWQALSSQPSE